MSKSRDSGWGGKSLGNMSTWIFQTRPNMWESSSVHKRMSSRELSGSFDRGSLEDRNSVDLQKGLLDTSSNDVTGPPWNRSLPHVCLAAVTSLLFGYHTGVVNDTLESMSVDLGFAGNTLEEGLVVSMCLLGAFIGCLFSGSAADGIGRKRSFQLSAISMIIGAFVSATTSNVTGMLMGRLLVGLGMGVGPPVASLYVTEVSPSSVRGTYGSFIQIATCLGIIGALFIGVPAKEVPGWWRVCFWVPVVPAIILAFGMEFCAESPHWLYKKGRAAEAEAQFERLFGAAHVKSAISELSRSEKGDDADVKFLELLHGRHFKVVYIGSMLFGLQQLSGINAVFYFSSTVFKNVGVPSEFATLAVGFCNLAGSIIAMTLMDRLGRKILLAGSFLGMAVALFVQVSAATFSLPSNLVLYLSVGGTLLFVFMFSLGAGPVPGLLLPEMFPSSIRAKAMAICMSVHWVVNFFIGLLFLRLLEQLGPRILYSICLYSICASFCLLAAMFVRRNVVETKGKSLQEIEIALLPPE